MVTGLPQILTAAILLSIILAGTAFLLFAAVRIVLNVCSHIVHVRRSVTCTRLTFHVGASLLRRPLLLVKILSWVRHSNHLMIVVQRFGSRNGR